MKVEFVLDICVSSYQATLGARAAATPKPATPVASSSSSGLGSAGAASSSSSFSSSSSSSSSSGERKAAADDDDLDGWGDGGDASGWGDGGGGGCCGGGGGGGGSGGDGGGGGGWGEMVGEESSSGGAVSVSDNREYKEYAALEQRLLAKEAALRADPLQSSVLDAATAQAAAQIFTPAEVSRMQINMLFGIMREAKRSGIAAEAVDDNMFHWRLRFRDFPSNSKLSAQLVQLESLYGEEHNSVMLDLKFDMELFPFYPPEARPVWPRLENAFMVRIVCMDELMVSKWKPIFDIKEILRSVKALMAAYGEVDIKAKYNGIVLLLLLLRAFACMRHSRVYVHA